MENKRIILILLVVVILVSIVSCKGKDKFKRIFSKGDEIEIIRSDADFDFEVIEDDSIRQTILYFKDREGLMVPVMRRLPWEEGIGKLALSNMVDGTEIRDSLSSIGLFPVIPAGTEILGMTIEPDTGLCKVDFSQEFLNYETEKEEENLIRGVVYTLTEFDAIDKVQFMVNGEQLSELKYGGNILGPIERGDINLVDNLEGERSRVVVYYKGNASEDEFEYFVPVTIPTLAPVPNIYTALEILFAGAPNEFELRTNIPEGTSFHGVDIKDRIAYVDISFDYGEPVYSEQILGDMIKNIGLTLSEFEEIREVKLLIEGKTLEETGVDLYINTSIPAFANEY